MSITPSGHPQLALGVIQIKLPAERGRLFRAGINSVQHTPGFTGGYSYFAFSGRVPAGNLGLIVPDSSLTPGITAGSVRQGGSRGVLMGNLVH